MKKLIILLAITQLTGCGILFAFLDSGDKCQGRGDPNYQYPSYCGSGSGTTYVTRDYRTGNYQSYTSAYGANNVRK